jgi:hypothetical protein
VFAFFQAKGTKLILQAAFIIERVRVKAESKTGSEKSEVCHAEAFPKEVKLNRVGKQEFSGKGMCSHKRRSYTFNSHKFD